MKCICGSGANEKIKDLEADCQTLQDRVMAVKGLWSVSIKNNTRLKAQVTWLENILKGACELTSRNFSPSSRP